MRVYVKSPGSITICLALPTCLVINRATLGILQRALNRHVGLTTQDFKSCASTYSATQAKKMVSRWRFELQTL